MNPYLRAVAARQGGVVLRGLPTWGLDLSEVHVSRADLHSPRHEAGVHHHAGELTRTDVEMVNGVLVTSAARTVIDTARMSTFEAAVVVADQAFRLYPEAQSAALNRLDQMRDWRGARNAGAVLAFADERSESVGESRCRVLFHQVGLPQPAVQHEFYSPNGVFIGRSDFYFVAQRTIGEFDGKAKYLRLLKPGEDPGEVVWREKRREDALREAGHEVVRVIWPDLDHPWSVEVRFRRAFSRASERTLEPY